MGSHWWHRSVKTSSPFTDSFAQGGYIWQLLWAIHVKIWTHFGFDCCFTEVFSTKDQQEQNIYNSALHQRPEWKCSRLYTGNMGYNYTLKEEKPLKAFWWLTKTKTPSFRNVGWLRDTSVILVPVVNTMLHKTLKIHLYNSYLGITDDRQNYSHAFDMDIIKCLVPKGHYFSQSGGLFPVKEINDHALALYFSDNNATKSHCSITSNNTSKNLIAQLSPNHYHSACYTNLFHRM